MRRKLLILACGVSFLVAMVWLGTWSSEIEPFNLRNSAQTQTVSAGPYQVQLQVTPNPPPTTHPTTLSLQILRHDLQRPLTHAHVTIESTMKTMDMGTEQVDASAQTPGLYQAQVEFSMSGPWQVQVLISGQGIESERATFDVTVR